MDTIDMFARMSRTTIARRKRRERRLVALVVIISSCLVYGMMTLM